MLEVARRAAAQVARQRGACRVLTNPGRYQDSKRLHFHVNAGEPLREAAALTAGGTIA